MAGAQFGMSVNKNHTKQTPENTSDDSSDELNVVIENLDFIEDTLGKLQKIAKNLNEVSLNYYLEMATLEAEQRLKNAKTQKDWLAKK